MRVDTDRFRENTCIECERYNKNGEDLKFGQCIADDWDVYRCARQKMFENNTTVRRQTE